ncbi:hypothetical protein EON80_04145 [bacterium]|nr:MAG: hypothetical protein EON80_04145 [bacterium]
MNLLTSLRSRFFKPGALSVALDHNYARLVAQRDEIGHRLEALKAEKRVANHAAAHAQADFVSARSRAKVIDQQRDVAIREMERTDGAIALVKSLHRATKK